MDEPSIGLHTRDNKHLLTTLKHLRDQGNTVIVVEHDEEIIEVLTSVKGIGRWTVEMILMFKLGRQDVMPATDLGVRKGYSIIFGHRDLATPKTILDYSQKWSPYRSFVAMYCWAAADG